MSPRMSRLGGSTRQQVRNQAMRLLRKDAEALSASLPASKGPLALSARNRQLEAARDELETERRWKLSRLSYRVDQQKATVWTFAVMTSIMILVAGTNWTFHILGFPPMEELGAPIWIALVYTGLSIIGAITTYFHWRILKKEEHAYKQLKFTRFVIQRGL